VSTLGTTNPEALDLYLLGQEQLKRRGEGVRQSSANFERAIRLDPNFARAYAALATALQLYPYFVGTRPADVKDSTIAAANSALALDSSLADPHVALGTAYAHAGRWQEAFAEFQRGVERDPDDVPARVAYGRYLVMAGRPAEALAQLREGKRVERISPLISAWIAYAYYATGQMDSAYAESQKAIQLDSTFLPAANGAMLVRLAEGRLDEARRVALRTPAGVMTNAPYVLAKAGDTASAKRLVHAMESATPRPWFADPATAGLALALGDSAAALSALERSQRTSGPIWAEYMGVFSPAYDLVRQSPRFIALVRGRTSIWDGLIGCVAAARQVAATIRHDSRRLATNAVDLLRLGLPSFHLDLAAEDRAPVLVFCHGHAAFDANPHARGGRWGVRREKAL